MGLFTPSPTINYNFVSGVYAFFSALCVLLAVLHKYTEAVEGFYIVLVPFLPALVWSLVVRAQWLKQLQETPVVKEEGEDAAAAEPESKKDK